MFFALIRDEVYIILLYAEIVNAELRLRQEELGKYEDF